MPNPTNTLKIPKSLYRKANEANILSEVLFYYELKRINPEGFFKRGKKISIIQNYTGLSASRIQQLISSCVDLGFLRRSNGCLSLCSYNRLWKYLNIPLSGLKLIKIDVKAKYSVKHLIQYEIIKNKVRGIERNLPKAYIKYLKDKGLIKSNVVSDQMASKIFQSRKNLAIHNYYGSIRKRLSSNSPYCTEPTITSSKIAELFGYKSAMQGYNVQKSLEEVGLIKVERNRILFISSKLNNYYTKSMINDSKDTSFFFSNGNLFKQLPNLMLLS